MDSDYDLFNLVLNSSNVSNLYNTQFTYNFIGGGFKINNDAQMCVSQITIPYSWFNINGNVYNNSSFSYRWYSSSSSYITYTVNLPAGNYTVNDINNYLQQYMISQNQYLIDSAGLYYFYIVITQNITYYSNQILTFVVPSSLPAGYTAPSGFVYSGYCPQVQILSNGFTNILGFSSGLYPSSISAVNYNALSNITPNLSPVNSIILLCNLVNNPISSPSNVVDSFSFNNTSFGSNITYLPNFSKYVSICKGNFNQLVLYMTDQNFSSFQANDPNVLISLIIKQKKENIIANPSKYNIKSLDFQNDNPDENIFS
jgi:hypothetical protein